jgi:CRISPR-associated endonuclease Cas1
MHEQATPAPDGHVGGNPARRREQHRDHGVAPAQLRRKGEVLVVDGHGVGLSVDRGRLIVRDGAGRQRGERSFGKVTHGLARVVILGSTGSVSLAALHWLRDQGVPLITLDDDSRLLCTSAASTEDARLLRAQALALHSPAGVAVARYLLREKLRGQLAVLKQVTARTELHDALSDELERLEHATTLDELLECEREGALVYWHGWREIEVRFVLADQNRIPEHWRGFGQRQSPLTSGSRLPINPANALLGYLYTLLFAEARVGCLTIGLSPTLGVVHADYRHRDSFCLDLVEAVRPAVDAYVFELLTTSVFRYDDFYATRRGGCRILAPLTHTLADTTNRWAELIAPVCEHVARLLADMPASRIDNLPTPLTGDNHQKAREPRRRRIPVRSPRPAAKPPRTCARCGGQLPHPGRVYCVPCEAIFRQEQQRPRPPVEVANAKREEDLSHGAEASKRRASTNVARKAAVREWDEQHGKLIDLSAFGLEILPLIQGVPLSRLQRATGLSLRYVSQIRRGEKTLHPLHWTAIEAAASNPN